MEPGKTPVSLLQEICTRKSINPKYDLLQVEGAVHEPIFQYRLTVEFNNRVFEETGSGRSKKEAKHNTANAMLIALEMLPKDGTNDKMGSASIPETDEQKGILEGDLSGNPVGLLQELCMKMKFSPPKYVVHSEEGLPHERIFALACVVGDREQYVEIGKGKSKKLAKRQAAHLMAERLRSIPSEKTNVHAFDEDDDKIIENINAGRKKVRGKKSKAVCKDGDTVESLVRRCQSIAMDKLALLKDPDFEPEDPVKYVAQIEEGAVKAVFIDFDELTTKGTYQCFVQVTSDPPTVSIGEGVTKEEAKINAAKDILNIYRIMMCTEL